MAKKKTSRPAKAATKARARGAKHPEPADVEGFFASLEHPHADALLALRNAILGADGRISEEIKWKVPSFKTTEHFATLHVRAKTGVGVILHFGAKKRDDLPRPDDIADPSALCAWLAADRAMVAFDDLADVSERRAALVKLIRSWIRYV